MVHKKNLPAIALASTYLILLFLFFIPTASAVTSQNNSSAEVYAYIPNFASNNVSVIDITTDNVTATVPVGVGPIGVAVDPDGAKVYVANYWSSDVSVIDAATNNVTATVKVGSHPYGVAVTPDGSKVYATNEWSHSVSVIDTATNNVTATVPVGMYPHGVVVTPDGTKVYVANQMNNTVSLINTTTNTIATTMPMETYPWTAVVSPDGTKVYVTNNNNNDICVIDTATNTIDKISLGFHPFGVAVTPDGKKLYVTSRDSNNVSVIDTATSNITDNVNVKSASYGVAVTPDGKKVYVTNEWSNKVSVIDTATNTLKATVAVGYNPIAFGQFIGSFKAQPAFPAADFSATSTSGTAPLNVSFTDTSIGTPTSWSWSFGDLKTSKVQKPSHIYKKAGTYTVSLTVKNAFGINTTTKTNYISVTNPPLVANLSATPTSGTAPLNVSFTDTSIGTPTSWSWSFGDLKTSNVQKPSHIYKNAGTYTVSLTVKNANGTNTTTKSGYIIVS